jgi:uncharacterized membrane protein YdjX (TVP38/TMEM64 family)
MLPASRAERARLVIAVCALGILIGCGIWLFTSGYLQVWWSRLSETFQSKEHLRSYVRSWGSWAPLAFICIQALQVVMAPIPGELTGVAGGFIFGAWKGTIFSTIGLTAGSAVAFLAARIVGQPLVKLVMSEETLHKFEHLTRGPRAWATLFLFVIPGFPKDILSYLLGLSPMRFLIFMPVCAVGRLPGTILLGAGGSALYKENWQALATICGACFVIFLAAYWKKEAIKTWLKH